MEGIKLRAEVQIDFSFSFSLEFLSFRLNLPRFPTANFLPPFHLSGRASSRNELLVFSWDYQTTWPARFPSHYSPLLHIFRIDSFAIFLVALDIVASYVLERNSFLSVFRFVGFLPCILSVLACELVTLPPLRPLSPSFSPSFPSLFQSVLPVCYL